MHTKWATHEKNIEKSQKKISVFLKISTQLLNETAKND